MRAHQFMLLVVALCLDAALATHSFELDKTYNYDFQGTIRSKLNTEEKPQYAGLAIKSQLALKKESDESLVIRLVNPKFATYNQIIADLAADMEKFDFKPFEESLSLGRAFKVYLKDNSIKAFDSFGDEQKWISNFKKGLLSFFQLKFNQQETSVFTVNEKSVFGECPTDYIVVAGNNQQTLNVTKSRNMSKCKTRFVYKFLPTDADECVEDEKDLEQFKHSIAMFSYDLVGTKNDYVIEKARLDEQATYSPFGRQGMSPSVFTNFQLTLNKDKSIPTPDLTVDTSNSVKIDNLAYDPPEMNNFYANINLNDEHHLANIYSFKPTVDQVKTSFNEFVEEYKKYSETLETPENDKVVYQQDSSLARLFMRLSDLVGTLNFDKLNDLYTKIDEMDSDIHKRVFWDVMGLTGTNPSFVFVKKMILDRVATQAQTLGFLQEISFHIKSPNKALFDEYINLCKSDRILNILQHKRLCALPLSSLIHQHCVKPHAKYLRMQQEGQNATAFKKAQNLCQIATAEEYFYRLVTVPASLTLTSESGSLSAASSSSESTEISLGEKLFNIKLAAELGIRPSFDLLYDTIRRTDEHPSLRSAAIWGLNKVAALYPGLIKNKIVPYFYDVNELLEVRLAAFHNWLISGMSLNDAEVLANKMVDEPNKQVVSYLHSFFKSAASIKGFPCTGKFEKNAKLVLPALDLAASKHGFLSLTDSRSSMSGTWQPEYSYGSASVKSMILSNDSFVPSRITFGSSELMTGLKFKPTMIVISTHGFDRVFKRIFGINGLVNQRGSIMDIFSLNKRRQTRQADQVKQELNEIEKELKLTTRELSEAFLSITVYKHGRPMIFMDKDSVELRKNLAEDGTIKIPAIKKLLHSFNNHTKNAFAFGIEKLEMTNNEMGFPIVQQLTDFSHSYFKLNSIKLDVEPGFFRDERQGQPPTKIAISLDARSHRQREFFAGFGTLLLNTKQKVGVGMHRKLLLNMPIKFSLEANLADHKVVIKREPIHENVLYVRQTPFTFLKQLDQFSEKNTVESATKPNWLAFHNLNRSTAMVPFKWQVMTPLAIGVKLEGKHVPGADWSVSAWRRYFSSGDMSKYLFDLMYSPSGVPFEASMSTVTTQPDANPTKEVTWALSWTHSGPDHKDDTYKAKLDDISTELEKETRVNQASMGDPTSIYYNLALLGGSEKERKVSVDLHYSRSFDRLIHKWRLFYQRTALDSSAAEKSEGANLCWFGTAKFPSYDMKKLINFDLLSMEHATKVNTELTFGEECNANSHLSASSKLTGNGLFEWSVDQRALIERVLSSSSRNEVENSDDSFELGLEQRYLTSLYKKCSEKRSQSKALVHQSCVDLLKRMTEMQRLSASFEHKNIPQRWMKYGSWIGKLYTYARANYIESMDDDYSKQGNEYKSNEDDPSKLDNSYLDANLTGPTSTFGERLLSYQIRNANYRVKYSGVPIGLPPLSTFPLLDENYYRTVQRRQENRICSVVGDEVTTFDNVTYTLPQVGDGCLKLVAKDCSPESNFVVLGAKAEAGKLVKVYVAQQYKVEFVPDKDGKSVAFVKINDQSIASGEFSSSNKAPVTRQLKHGTHTKDAFAIDFNGAYYTLSSKLYKFAVSTDGTWILVQQSKYYAGKSCGICGDANGDQLFEFKSPSSAQKVCKNSSDFVWSYTLPSTCASRPSVECA